MNIYNIGEQIRLLATYRRQSDNELIDPSVVVFVIFHHPNDGSPFISGVYVYGVNAEVIRTATGMYYMDYLPHAHPQLYVWKSYSTGSVNSASEEVEFMVQ